jgi:hypothetical protein
MSAFEIRTTNSEWEHPMRGKKHAASAEFPGLLKF